MDTDAYTVAGVEICLRKLRGQCSRKIDSSTCIYYVL